MARFGLNLAELKSARFLLEQLAEGIDPTTEERLPCDHAAQDPEAIRAIFIASRILYGLEEELAGMPTPPRRLPSTRAQKAGYRPRAGKPWTKQEEAQLIDAFTRRVALSAIASAHGRSSGGIASRLVELGLIRQRQDARSLLRHIR